MKPLSYIKSSIFISIFAAAIASPVFAVDLLDPALRPQVPFNNGFEGIWQGTLPAGVAGVAEDATEEQRVSVLQLCVVDNKSGTDFALKGKMINPKSDLELLQDNAQIEAVGKRLKIKDSMSYTTDSPSDKAMAKLRGKKKREALLAVEIADEKDAAVAEPGDLVGTLGNEVSVVWKYVRENPRCSGKDKKRKSKRKRKRSRK